MALAQVNMVFTGCLIVLKNSRSNVDTQCFASPGNRAIYIFRKQTINHLTLNLLILPPDFEL
jgi:hypothetical protein